MPPPRAKIDIMFGIGSKSEESDQLSVQVNAVAGDEVFGLAQKIWTENARTMLLDSKTGKEFLHLAYANPKSVAWLQRDQGRAGTLELIVRWEADKTHEVFVITGGQPAGNQTRAKAILTSMLTTPSVVPSTGK